MITNTTGWRRSVVKDNKGPYLGYICGLWRKMHCLYSVQPRHYFCLTRVLTVAKDAEDTHDSKGSGKELKINNKCKLRTGVMQCWLLGHKHHERCGKSQMEEVDSPAQSHPPGLRVLRW